MQKPEWKGVKRAVAPIGVRPQRGLKRTASKAPKGKTHESGRKRDKDKPKDSLY
jgi:hypothetical protein